MAGVGRGYPGGAWRDREAFEARWAGGSGTSSCPVLVTILMNEGELVLNQANRYYWDRHRCKVPEN